MLVSPKVSQECLVIHTAFHLKRVWRAEKLGVSLLATTGGIVNDYTKAETMRPLLSIRETQEYFRISRSSVYRLINRRELVVVYVLGSPRITAASVESFITRQIASAEVAR
jgi:predicted DNA-binding transcriptional regulator AlpA